MPMMATGRSRLRPSLAGDLVDEGVRRGPADAPGVVGGRGKRQVLARLRGVHPGDPGEFLGGDGTAVPASCRVRRRAGRRQLRRSPRGSQPYQDCSCWTCCSRSRSLNCVVFRCMREQQEIEVIWSVLLPQHSRCSVGPCEGAHKFPVISSRVRFAQIWRVRARPCGMPHFVPAHPLDPSHRSFQLAQAPEPLGPASRVAGPGPSRRAGPRRTSFADPGFGRERLAQPGPRPPRRRRARPRASPDGVRLILLRPRRRSMSSSTPAHPQLAGDRRRSRGPRRTGGRRTRPMSVDAVHPPSLASARGRASACPSRRPFTGGDVGIMICG